MGDRVWMFPLNKLDELVQVLLRLASPQVKVSLKTLILFLCCTWFALSSLALAFYLKTASGLLVLGFSGNFVNSIHFQATEKWQVFVSSIICAT
jgi:uncharacterized membrane protein